MTISSRVKKLEDGRRVEKVRKRGLIEVGDFLRAAGVDVPAGPVYVNPAEIAAALVETEPVFRAE